MEFDLGPMDFASRYRLLSGVVVPRPIAWVTSLDERGRVNAAPFSFFNAFGADPPMIVIGVSPQENGGLKDTAHNIRAHRQFVVNLVAQDLAEAMNVCATAFAAGVDELEQAGLSTAPSVSTDVPRIAQSPVHLECREAAVVEIGRNRLVLGEVVHIAVADRFITDPDKPHVATHDLGLIGRMASPGGYVRTTDLFQIDRLDPTDFNLPPRPRK